VSRWVAAVGIAGTVMLAVGAFSLSFTSLTRLAVRSGVEVSQAWEWPLIVDGVIVVATVSVVALAGRRGTGYAWALLICAALVSIGGNAAQAARLPTEEPAWIAAAVATVPPIVLLAATHMTVILTRPEQANNLPVATPTPSREAPGAARETPAAPRTTPALDAATLSRAVLATSDLGGSPSISPVVPSAPAGPRRTEVDVGDESRTFKADKAQRLRADGWTTTEIAQELGVSTGSVRRYLKPTPPTTEDDSSQGDFE